MGATPARAPTGLGVLGVKVFYECFIAVFGVPAKLLSDRGVNFTSTLVEELCSAFGIQK